MGQANQQDNSILKNVQHHVSQLEMADTKESYLEQVYQIFEIYGLRHGCLHNLGAAKTPRDALWRVSPDDINAACRYLISEDKHPAIRLAENRYFAYDLFDFRHTFGSDPDIEALYVALEANGLNQAYCLPIHTSDRGTFVFIIGRPDSPIETIELLTLQTICANAVNRVQQFELNQCEAKKNVKLSKQDREILIAIAKGGSATEVSKVLGVSEITIRSMTDNIQTKFKAQNISHAIILALIEGEFGLADCIATN